MSDADELARRFVGLWAEYLTALVSDPQAAELLQRWIAFTAQFASQSAGASGEGGAKSFAGWPPIPAELRPHFDAAAPAGASRQRGDAMGKLARRVDELERRLAALEPEPRVARPRRRNPQSGG